MSNIEEGNIKIEKNMENITKCLTNDAEFRKYLNENYK